MLSKVRYIYWLVWRLHYCAVDYMYHYMVTHITMFVTWRNCSNFQKKFTKNFLIENLEDMFPLYYMHSDMFSMFVSSTIVCYPEETLLKIHKFVFLPRYISFISNTSHFRISVNSTLQLNIYYTQFILTIYYNSTLWIKK